MLRTLALSLALAAPAARAQASSSQPSADAPAASTAAASGARSLSADDLDRACEEHVKRAEDCVDTLEYFRADLKTKKAALDKEFKGQIPDAFTPLLNMKAGRIEKLNGACARLLNGKEHPIDDAMESIRSMDASSPAYLARRKKLDELRERFNKAMKRFVDSR